MCLNGLFFVRLRYSGSLPNLIVEARYFFVCRSALRVLSAQPARLATHCPAIYSSARSCKSIDTMAPEKMASSETGAESEYTRLHITPFNAALLSAIVPPSMAGSARNVSFHQLQAFPEKEYGFVELPAEQATKIRKKLNGAILRGSKIVIEEAREKRRIVSPDPEMAEKEGKRKKEGKEKGEVELVGGKESKKRKRHEEPIKGGEVLDRQIKRGWTDPDAKKKDKKGKDKDKKDKNKEREKSKYTTEAECLFRTTLPPNVVIPAKGMEGVIVDKKKREGKKGKDVVVHEFAKTEKFATFLRSKGGPVKAKPAAEYVEGKGWVDEDGNVVEGEPPKPKHNDDVLKEIAKKNKVVKPPIEVVQEDSSEEESDGEDADIVMNEAAVPLEESETSSSGSSSEDEDDSSSTESEEESEKESALPTSTSDRPITPPNPPTITTAPALSISIPSPAATTAIHPLEALYKRRKPDANVPSLPATGFTFFGGDENSDIENEDQTEHVMPMTPFTQQDFSLRGMRSAAPTPDTAHPLKGHLSWPAHEEDEEEEYGVGIQHSSPTRKGDVVAKAEKTEAEGEQKGKEETDPSQDFQKWFYEHRGDTNRAWKKRRKEVKKEVRQRENRKRGGAA